MTVQKRLGRLEAAQRRRPVVVPTYDLDLLTEDEVRFMIALHEKLGQDKDLSALTEDEVQALIAIQAKMTVVK